MVCQEGDAMTARMTDADAKRLGIDTGKAKKRQQADASKAKQIDLSGCMIFWLCQREHVRFMLPMPPSTNVYWRHWRGHTVISKDGRAYQHAVAKVIGKAETFGSQRLRMMVILHAPDKKRRDLDNLGKSLMDSLTYAGLYADDSQIDDLRFVRGENRKPGRIVVEMSIIE
jgi:crossover junction endodeoxyribonuclease RusA